MPELPEVETIARCLREGGRGGQPVLGLTISGVELTWPRTLAHPLEEEFRQRLVGQRIEEIGRRGKFLHLRLTRDSLLIHLRMSGDLRVEPETGDQGISTPLQPHDRLVLRFTNGLRLAFNDTRKFGRVWLAQDPQEVTRRLGPEPLGSEFTAGWLYDHLRTRRRQIKPLLLDQSFIAGIGNIYTDEALFLAKIHPLRLSDSLSREESERLWAAIREVLQEGIRRNGASFDWVYRGGEFHFNVYQRTGEPCPVCGAPIQKIAVGQRGTHFCVNCQPESAI